VGYLPPAVTGESYEQCQARFVEERRQKVCDETASIIQKRFKAAQRKIHESDVALEKEIRAAADSFVGINGNAAKRDKLLSDNQSESRVAIELTIFRGAQCRRSGVEDRLPRSLQAVQK
jgi:hypothetical protein